MAHSFEDRSANFSPRRQPEAEHAGMSASNLAFKTPQSPSANKAFFFGLF